ncbi:MAG: hypothetical protein CL569_00525 [Alphaproteobacteria bacterium]|nr:hypothetical protein [Alphaproteobacteria bacterium]|tara:strand:- start:1686 stop:2015 length:330 start_codon:yes stop_codon:yes gene_type:complete
MSSPNPEPSPNRRTNGASVTYRYRVTAEPEVSVLSRVLELFVIRDALPSRVTSEVVEGHEPVQEIEVDVGGLEDRMARHLSVRIQQFPAVHTVSMRQRQKFDRCSRFNI